MRYVQYLDYDLTGKLSDVLGDRGTVILDARNSIPNSISDAHYFNGFRRDFYPAFRLHQGQSFTQSKAITGIIYATKIKGGNKMKTYTIPAKMSNTGSIHDLARSACDRDIRFPAGTKFAVVLAGYYGGKGYTTHKTQIAAIRQARRLSDYSLDIIDYDGNTYDIYYDYERTRLIKRQGGLGF